MSGTHCPLGHRCMRSDKLDFVIISRQSRTSGGWTVSGLSGNNTRLSGRAPAHIVTQVIYTVVPSNSFGSHDHVMDHHRPLFIRHTHTSVRAHLHALSSDRPWVLGWPTASGKQTWGYTECTSHWPLLHPPHPFYESVHYLMRDYFVRSAAAGD